MNDNFNNAIYPDETKAYIFDPAQPSIKGWGSANNITSKLLACIESIKDIELLLTPSFLSTKNWDKRIIKILATHLHSLGLSIDDIFKDIEGKWKEYQNCQGLDKKEISLKHKEFNQKSFDADKIKIIRDKIGAHIDHKDIFAAWQHVNAENTFKYLLHELDYILFISSNNIFSWCKEGNSPDSIILMIEDPMSIELRLKNKKPVEIIKISIVTESPKTHIQNMISNLKYRVYSFNNTLQKT